MGEGDRPTEIKSTSGRARGERPRSAYLLLLARRGAGEPTGESHLSAHASSYPFPPFCLSLVRSRSPSPQSSPSLPGPSLCLFHLLALDGLLPIPGVHYLSFFFYFLRPPLVQMARTISRHVVPHGILRERRVFLSIGTIENLSKNICDCRGERIE